MAGEAPRQRLFIALWPPAWLQDTAAALARSCARGGRVLPAGNIHLTLAFLGDLRADAVPELGEVIARAATAVPPRFELHLDRLGLVRGRGLLWLSPSNPPEALHHLHARLNEGLAAAGFPVEQRAFRPHLTLGRKVREAREGEVQPLVWPVDAVSLVASRREASGAVYSVLQQWP